MTALAARMSDSLVDSIGVNTHLGYTDRAYFSRFLDIGDRLGALGVRHLRDGLDTRPVIADRMGFLFHRYGIRFVQGIGPRVNSRQPWRGKLDPAKIGAQLDALKSAMGDANEAIEGPNEYDVTAGHDDPSVADPNWPATLLAFTQALWDATRRDPYFAKRPVFGPPLAHAGNAPKLGDLSAFVTHTNLHPYPGGWNPSRGLDDYNLPNYAKINNQKKPLVATETGYHNALKSPPGGHEPAPADVVGRYAPRLVAEYFRRGFARAYFYELLDQGENGAEQEQNFGLLRHDLAPKPAFDALATLIALCNDPGKAFTTRPLELTIVGGDSDTRTQLLQKRDGRYLLLLWQETAVWDPKKRSPIPVSARKITVSWSGKRAARRFEIARGKAPVETARSVTSLPITLNDDLQLVELAP